MQILLKHSWKIILLGALFIGIHLVGSSQEKVDRHFDVCRTSAQCTVEVERVVDGDTIVVAGGKKVRFDSINAIELDQPGGEIARACVIEVFEHVSDGLVTLRVTGIDTYGRTLARVMWPSLRKCDS